MKNRATVEIAREEAIHGSRWESLHDGYFSSHTVASPFTDTIRKKIREARPGIIADLGGGTGFILTLLSHAPEAEGVEFIAVDNSARQLGEAAKRGIHLLQKGVEDVTRQDLSPGDRPLMLIMRSVIHYFGKDSMSRVLGNIRRIARDGEYFIHQSASFPNAEQADCLNLLYSLMGTQKWYPDRDFMCMALKNAGWRVDEIIDAPTLLLKSDDLRRRYSLTSDNVREIIQRISSEFPDMDEVFRTMGNNTFEAELKYAIYICRA